DPRFEVDIILEGESIRYRFRPRMFRPGELNRDALQAEWDRPDSPARRALVAILQDYQRNHGLPQADLSASTPLPDIINAFNEVQVRQDFVRSFPLSDDMNTGVLLEGRLDGEIRELLARHRDPKAEKLDATELMILNKA